jgi:iron(III) transport system ATP-binding protein
VPVLHGIDLDVAAGEVVAVTGPSGAGKTTLLSIISGEEAADDGRITVAGKIMVDDRTDVPASRRPIASVPQGATLLDDRQVGTNIVLALPRRERTKHASAARVAQMFDLVGLPTALADRRPPELSISERQRVLLARALVGWPDLLLLDEPFFAFDPSTRARLRPELRQVLHAAGVGTVLVSHHASDIAEVVDRRWRLHEGRLVPHPTH